MPGEKGLDVKLTVLEAWQVLIEAHVGKLVNWWLSRLLPFPYHPDTRRLSKRIDGVALLGPLWGHLLLSSRSSSNPVRAPSKLGELDKLDHTAGGRM